MLQGNEIVNMMGDGCSPSGGKKSNEESKIKKRGELYRDADIIKRVVS